MAVYDAECPKCGRQEQYICPIADMNKMLPTCEKCSLKMTRVILTAPMVSPMIWTSHKATMVAGKWCETGSDYKKLMKEGGYIPEAEARQEASRVRTERKKQHRKKLDHAISKALRTTT